MDSRVMGAALAAVSLAGVALANVQVSSIFSSNMVLQRERPVPVWGTADPGEAVSVSFAGQTVKTVAGKDGAWEVKLAPLAVSKENRDFVVSGKNTLTLKNVLVGDVWLCSGQSNMEMSFGWGIIDGAAVKADSVNYPTIRHIKIRKVLADFPQAKVPADGQWTKASDVLDRVTACGYFFARKLTRELGIPIGILADNWSGCRIEPFVSCEGFRGVPELKSFVAQADRVNPETPAGRATWTAYCQAVQTWLDVNRALVSAGKLPQGKLPVAPQLDNGAPCGQYNAMIAPIVRFPITGALWYQGCSNGGEGDIYTSKMKALINGWRQAWGYEFPFYFVQLASFQGATDDPVGGNGYAKIRNAQRLTLAAVPKTGMAVTIDIGNGNDIHPKDKLDVGERLALWALANDYGRQGLVCSGPLFKGFKAEGNKLRVSFDSVGSGLMVGSKNNVDLKPAVEVKGGKLEGFAIAGADKKWVWADAAIEGNEVVLSSPSVAAPVAIRYAFRANPMGHCSLYNKEGLPASPFRTDRW